MHRFAMLCLQAVVPAVLSVVLTVAPATAHAQSPHKCSAQGRTWYQDGACITPQPHDRTLRKCVSPKGAVSIQNEPCPAGSRTAWVRPTVPEQLSEARRHSLQQQARKRDADSRYLSRLAGTDGLGRQYIYRTHSYPMSSYPRPSRTSAKHAACDAARRHRETTLERVGLARTVDLLRALNDRVYEACQ